MFYHREFPVCPVQKNHSTDTNRNIYKCIYKCVCDIKYLQYYEKQERGGKNFLGDSDFWLPTGCATQTHDSDFQNIHVNFVEQNLAKQFCRANQWTGFYMITASVMIELRTQSMYYRGSDMRDHLLNYRVVRGVCSKNISTDKIYMNILEVGVVSLSWTTC